MKPTLSFYFLLLGLVSCNVNDYEVKLDKPIMEDCLTKSIDSSEWFDFDEIINDALWLFNEDVQVRVAMIQIPESQLSIMPVDTLLDRCIRYPFYCDFTAANNVKQGVIEVMSGFNGFSELHKRPEVATALVKRYRQESISDIARQLSNGETTSSSELLREYFIELIISQYLMSFPDKELRELETLFNQKMIEKENNPEIFGGLSHQVGNVLRNSMNVRMKQNKSWIRQGNRSLTETIYTIFGKSLISLIKAEEFSTAEAAANDAAHMLLHPLATLLSTSTTTYNCHSYAWHMSSGGDTRWINGSLYGQPNLDGTVNSYIDNVEAFWTDGFYAPTTSSRKDKIYYYRGDHSATISSLPGKYESKWGQGPLMRHSPTDCPSIYHSSFQTYYCPCYLILQCSAGIGPVSVNQSAIYTAIDIPLGISSSYSWSVCDHKGDETIGTHAIVQNATSSSAQITFTMTGIYEITLTRYHPYRGTMHYTYEALVTN